MDEELSTYVRSAGLFGTKRQGPIKCIANSIPATVGRWNELTQKGRIWKDLELENWLVNMDDEDCIKNIPETILPIATDPVAANAHAEAGRKTW